MRAIANFLIRFNIVIASGVTGLGAFLALAFNRAADPISLAVLWVAMWQIYTLDRLIKQPEDKLTTRRTVEELLFIQKQQKLFRALFVITGVVEVVLIVLRPLTLVGVAVGVAGGMMYSLKIPVINVRVKKIPLLKSIYVPTVLLAMPMLVPWALPKTPAHWAALLALEAMQIVNVYLFDVRDTERDRSEGIITLANFVGARRLLVLTAPLVLVVGAICLAIDHGVIVWCAVGGLAAMALSGVRLWRHAPLWYYAIVIDGLMAWPLVMFLTRQWWWGTAWF